MLSEDIPFAQEEQHHDHHPLSDLKEVLVPVTCDV